MSDIPSLLLASAQLGPMPMVPLFVALFLMAGSASGRENMTLQSADGLAVTADIYRHSTKPDAPWLVLAHQAGASRGEYRTIAPRLNKLGFNTIAIDQRSGKAFDGVRNETAQRAAARGIGQAFGDALPDIEAAIRWARKQTTGPVILWGSSYSAALALLIAGGRPGLVDGVVAMSPGEDIDGQSVAQAAAAIKVPVLIMSAANERTHWHAIFKAIADRRKAGFAPEADGQHGSSALIAARSTSAAAYWEVVEKFLTQHLAKN